MTRQTDDTAATCEPGCAHGLRHWDGTLESQEAVQMPAQQLVSGQRLSGPTPLDPDSQSCAPDTLDSCSATSGRQFVSHSTTNFLRTMWPVLHTHGTWHGVSLEH